MKKKMLIASLAIILVGIEVRAQDYFRDRTNVVLFGGYHANQLNTNDNGNYEGVYVDYLAFKSDWSGWSAGPYLSVSRSTFALELSQYDSKSQEISFGGTVGYYAPNFSAVNQAFTGLSLGLKSVSEDGESLIRKGPSRGHYFGRQKDLMLTTAINFNLMKSEWAFHPDIFTRLQVMVTGQFPISSSKESFWNDSLLTGDPWDKTYVQVLGKESLAKFGLSDKLFFSPKVVALYAYSRGDNSQAYGIGVELSLFKIYKEDFLSISGIYKISEPGKSNVFLWGLNFNVASLFSK
jgi:hypothetical protein